MIFNSAPLSLNILHFNIILVVESQKLTSFTYKMAENRGSLPSHQTDIGDMSGYPYSEV